jgi:hypothetical protein
MRKVIAGLVAFIIVFLAAIVGSELIFRGYRLVRAARGDISVSIMEVDEELGWLPTPGYVFYGNKRDASGQPKSVNSIIDAERFQAFGDVMSDRPRILVVGDSFTQAVGVPRERTYYALLGKMFPAEIFTYGTSGYSTLQEIMIAERYVTTINPSILLLQFHFADFYNNSLELETLSWRYNAGLRRPYLRLDGRIEYALPRRLASVREFIINRSRVTYFLWNQWDSFWARQGDPIQSEIEQETSYVEAYRDAVKITGQLFRRLREGVGRQTRVIVFITDNREPYYDDFRLLIRESGLESIEEVPQAFAEAGAERAAVFSADGIHWGIDGHHIAATAIASYLTSAEAASLQ